MLDTSCMICRKDFVIDNNDYQYLKIKYQESKLYICRKCNFFLQREAIKTTGIDPDEIDRFDKFIR